MKIRIAGLVNDSIVDGPGLRFTIFAQGCVHRCPGCHNPQTHDFCGGTLADTDEIIAHIRKNPLLDGVTFSGGEPFNQPLRFVEIAKAVHEMGLDIWCYTGYTFEELNEGLKFKKRRELLLHVDTLVDGRFEIDKKTLECPFRGSSNQRIIDVPASLSKGEVVTRNLQAPL